MNASDEVLTVAAVAKNNPVSEEEKAQWARRFVESGLSLREFSAQNGLGYVSLWRWVNKARGQGVGAADSPAAAFTEIKLLPATEPAHWVAEWSWPNGAVLRISKEVPAAVLEQLLRVC
jgi:transposase-like protein